MARRNRGKRTTPPVFRDEPTPAEVLANEGIADESEPLGGTITDAAGHDPARVDDWRARNAESVGWVDVPASAVWPVAAVRHVPSGAELAEWAMTPPPAALGDVLADWPAPVELAEPVARRRPRVERVARWVVPAAFLVVAGLFVVGTVAG